MATIVSSIGLKGIEGYRVHVEVQLLPGVEGISIVAIQGVIERVKETGIEVIVYEPVIQEDTFDGLRVVNDFDAFKEVSDVIVANILSEEIKDVRNKVYTRDLFSRD